MTGFIAQPIFERGATLPPLPERSPTMRKRLPPPFAGAVAGAGLLLFAAAPLAPAQAQVECSGGYVPGAGEPGPWVRGTLDHNGEWAPDSAGADYQIVCTRNTNRDTLDIDDLPNFPAEAIPLLDAARIVVDVSDPDIDFVYDKRGGFKNTRMAVTGQLGASDGDDGGIEIDIESFEEPQNNYILESFATIAASGLGRRGIDLKNDDTAHTGRIEAVNRGAITTTGSNEAHGIFVSSQSEARATNRAKASIDTHGDGATGVFAQALGDGGSATAENLGRVTTHADAAAAVPGGDPIGSHGVFAESIFGEATARNKGGTIDVSSPRAHGLHADAADKTAVIADGGMVTASHDDPVDDANDGVGIYARGLSATGSITVDILNGAVIRAPQAVLLEDKAPATVTVSEDSQVLGRVAFGDGAGTLRVINGARFGGAITGLETFKGSGGWIRFDDNVKFTGSSATFEDETLVSISGTFDLGPDGTMTIHDGARVQLVAARGKEELPRIIAGGHDDVPGISCLDSGGTATDCTLYVQNYEGAEATAGDLVDYALSPDTTLSGDRIRYVTQRADGGADPVATAALNEDGEREGDPEFHVDRDKFRPGPPRPYPGGSSGGGSSKREALAGLGLLGLIFALIDFGPDEELAPALSKPAFVQADGSGSRWWTRNLAEALPAGGPGAAEGVEIGMEAEVGNGFTLGFAAAPDMAAQQAAGAEAAAFSGSRYSLRGGWRGERLFAGLRLSHADWRVEGGWDNAAVGERMRSRFDAAHRDVRLSLGARLGLGGGMVLIPQADAFAGEIERGSHTAEGAEFRAAMPGMTQRYSGVRAGLGFASDWQEAGHGLKLRPKLNLSAMRVQADSKGFELRQSHRLGVLSTSSRARLAGGPETVFGLGAGLEAAGPGGLQLGFGYAGLMVDGKLTHAAAARLRLPF